MTDKEIIREIGALSWTIRATEWNGNPTYQAFFRGFQTEWRGSPEQVLADVKAYQEPEKANE